LPSSSSSSLKSEDLIDRLLSLALLREASAFLSATVHIIVDAADMAVVKCRYESIHCEYDEIAIIDDRMARQ
jgi:hypothetical protein